MMILWNYLHESSIGDLLYHRFENGAIMMLERLADNASHRMTLIGFQIPQDVFLIDGYH